MGPQSWLGIKFLDNLYLGRFEVSPSLEIARLPEQTRVTLTGSHELDPGLTSEQTRVLEFLGWEKPRESICDCWFKIGSCPDSASQLVRQGIECLLFIYGISAGCPIVTSSEHINSQLLKLKESRQVRRPDGIRLQRPLSKRDELR